MNRKKALSWALAGGIAVTGYIANPDARQFTGRYITTPVKRIVERAQYGLEAIVLSAQEQTPEIQLRLLRNSYHLPYFTKEQVSWLTADGIDLDYVWGLANIRDINGDSVYLDALTMFILREPLVFDFSVSVPLDYARQLATLTAEDGMPRFRKMNSLVDFYQNKVDVNFIKRIIGMYPQSVLDSLNHYDIIDFYNSKIPMDYIRELLEHKRKAGSFNEGAHLFSPQDIISCYRQNISVSDMEFFAKAVSKHGNLFLEGESLADLRKSGVPLETIKEMVSLKHPDGNSVFEFGSGVYQYLRSGGTTDTVKKMLMLNTTDEDSVFEGDHVLDFLNNGGTLQYAMQITSITDKAGVMLFDGFDIYLFHKAQGTYDYARAMSQIKDIDGSGVYDGFAIANFKTQNISVAQAKKLAEFKNTEGYSLFKYNAIDFFKSGLDFSVIEKWMRVRDKQGHIPLSGADIVYFEKNNIPLHYVQGLADIADAGGNSIFSGWGLDETTGDVQTGFILYAGIKGTLRFAKTLAAILDDDGNPIFNGVDIYHFLKSGRSAYDAYQLSKIRDVSGNRFFTDGNSINKFMDNCPTQGLALFRLQDVLTEARRWANYVPQDDIFYNGFVAYRCKQLGLGVGDLAWTDTQKPNALIVLPKADWNGAFETKETNDLFREIAKAYDVAFRFAEKEIHVYQAISSISDIELLILAGHGSPLTLSLGEEDLGVVQKPDFDEQQMLDTSDSELSFYLSKLAEIAAILLASCSNAGNTHQMQFSHLPGYERGTKLAEFIFHAASQRTTIAGRRSFAQRNIQIQNLYPFQAAIIDNGRDITAVYSRGGGN